MLDSRCEGVMISPKYAQAMGIRTFKLEQPIGLQLACVVSKSMINYGSKSTIAFGNKLIEEYFDLATIDHYDVILGTPFLWQLGIALDFSGQGTICIGTYTVPMNKPLESSAGLPKTAAGKRLKPKPPE